MQRRPIVNTRDEPHADRQIYRRFHVILGDSNLSLYSTYLKIGTTALVLQALLNGAPLSRVPVLADPLGALKGISRDYYEAAQIDGAGRWASFRYVTVPQLSPVIFLVVILGLIVGTIVIALFMPLLGLLEGLSGGIKKNK